MQHLKLFDSHNGDNIEFSQLLNLKIIAKRYKISISRKNKHNISADIISKRLGRGMDFAEVREYFPGDDARNIDWRVTARTGKPHTKIFEQEHNRTVFLIVDLSRTMQFATKNAFKSIVAIQIATVLAFITKQQKENLKFLIFNDTESYIFQGKKSSKNSNSELQLVKHLVAMQSNKKNKKDEKKPQNNLNTIFSDISLNPPKNCLIITLSDFFNLNDNFINAVKILSNKNDLLNIKIIDHTEKNPLPQGRYPISENNKSRILNINSKQQQQKYQEILLSQHEKFNQLCKKFKITMLEILTCDDFMKKLRTILTTNGG